MNRSAAAALAVCAVIGVVGGTYAATVVGGEDRQEPPTELADGTTTPPTSTAGESESPKPRTPAQLLYMDGTAIHDGYTHVSSDGLDPAKVSSLVRIRGGWLVVLSTSDQEPAFEGVVVAADGERTKIGAFQGRWDINEDGSRFVALHDTEYRVTDLTNGAVLDVALAGPEDAEPVADAAFAGDAVLTGWTAESGNRAIERTDLTTGKSRVIRTDLLTSWTASPRGVLMTGESASERGPCIAGGQVLGDGADWWDTCDWRYYGLRPQYSPNGEQLLAVPYETDGFGPGLFGVLDSETGRVLAEIDTPDWTLTAEWGDNDEVFVLGQRNADDVSSVIYRCQVDGDCATERESRQRLVLGTGT